jgi:hypothetical protein
MYEHDVKEIVAQIKARTARLKRDPQAARRLLARAGILDQNGQIHPYYREVCHASRR